MKKERADKIVAGRGLAESPQKAQALIMAGLVFSEGQRIEKPGQMIGVDQEISLKEKMPYVSRGGLKLKEALEAFQIPIQGKVAADLGASTGGFIDCLLQKGAKRIYAVDVDIRQIDWRLREDSRVICIQKNARYLKKDDFGDALDIITTDLSFISVLKVLPAVKEFLGGGRLLSLIKPQFEVEKGQVGKKGVVRNPALHEDVLDRIIEEAHKIGFALRGLIKSSHRGQKGNREFFISWSLEEESLGQGEVQRLIKEAVWNEKN
jgi:23S rRNA (cytidine1920-2'-O)/16S rRNA (cytidine1409-2'-O)-methyltransferase